MDTRAYIQANIELIDSEQKEMKEKKRSSLMSSLLARTDSTFIQTDDNTFSEKRA